MTSPIKPWESNTLQNSNQIIRNSNTISQMPSTFGHSAPVLPPRPSNTLVSSNYNSYLPFSGMSSYGGYNSYGSYGSYGMPYRSSYYNSSYGNGYNSYGMYGSGNHPYGFDDSERRFIQYAEESSRNTFANVESIVRAFNSMAMMLDNTFFAMTSSFRAILSVAENFGRLKNMFGHIWYSVNVFRFFNWLLRKIRQKLGFKVPPSTSSLAWKEAVHGGGAAASPAGGSSWPTLAFLGVLVSAPYIISKFLPKYEDKSDPSNWKTPGIKAKAAFDFIATSPNELTIHTNDIINLAPTYIQDEMKLKNTGWAFAEFNGKSGVVPLNYLVISKSRPLTNMTPSNDNRVFNNNNNIVTTHSNNSKSHNKRVSFGENQIFENIDLDDYIRKPEKETVVEKSVLKSSLVNNSNNNSDNTENSECTKNESKA